MINKRYSLAEAKEKRTFSKDRYFNRKSDSDKFYVKEEERENIENRIKNSNLLDDNCIPIGILSEYGRFAGPDTEEMEDIIDDIGEELVKSFPNEDIEIIEDALFEDIEGALSLNKYLSSIYELFFRFSKEGAIESLMDCHSIDIVYIDPETFIYRIKHPDWVNAPESDGDGQEIIYEFLYDSYESRECFYDTLKPIMEEKRKKIPKILAKAYADFINEK